MHCVNEIWLRNYKLGQWIEGDFVRYMECLVDYNWFKLDPNKLVTLHPKILILSVCKMSSSYQVFQNSLLLLFMSIVYRAIVQGF